MWQRKWFWTNITLVFLNARMYQLVNWQTMWPVSYTHLDVYKRQVLYTVTLSLILILLRQLYAKFYCMLPNVPLGHSDTHFVLNDIIFVLLNLILHERTKLIYISKIIAKPSASYMVFKTRPLIFQTVKSIPKKKRNLWAYGTKQTLHCWIICLLSSRSYIQPLHTLYLSSIAWLLEFSFANICLWNCIKPMGRSS